MDKLAKALGERIRVQRKACRISQDALALACNIDRSYVGRIERGEVNITVHRIASVLACACGLLPRRQSFSPPDRRWRSRRLEIALMLSALTSLSRLLARTFPDACDAVEEA